jgi:D-sedoheptulose 7-phosphate isomerase
MASQPDKFEHNIAKYMVDSVDAIEAMKKQTATISMIAKKLNETRAADSTIYIMGNGGSASTASHMANDLNKASAKTGKKRFKAISLADNMPLFSAWANDNSYDVVFEEQLRNFLAAKDVVIGISGSGNSPNIIKGIEYANKTGAFTIGITGNISEGGKLAKTANLSIIVPDNLMYRIEDLHLMLNHILAYAFLHED